MESLSIPWSLQRCNVKMEETNKQKRHSNTSHVKEKQKKSKTTYKFDMPNKFKPSGVNVFL